MVIDMTKSVVKPKNILRTLKEHNDKNVTTIKQVYSAHFPPMEDAPTSPASPSRRRVGCDMEPYKRLYGGGLFQRDICLLKIKIRGINGNFQND